MNTPAQNVSLFDSGRYPIRPDRRNRLVSCGSSGAILGEHAIPEFFTGFQFGWTRLHHQFLRADSQELPWVNTRAQNVSLFDFGRIPIRPDPRNRLFSHWF